MRLSVKLNMIAHGKKNHGLAYWFPTTAFIFDLNECWSFIFRIPAALLLYFIVLKAKRIKYSSSVHKSIYNFTLY